MINTSGDCGLLDTKDCGYCVSTDTIAAGDEKKPFVRACITSKWKSGEPEDGEWLGPNMKDSKGRGVDYYCQKKKNKKYVQINLKIVVVEECKWCFMCTVSSNRKTNSSKNKDQMVV